MKVSFCLNEAQAAEAFERLRDHVESLPEGSPDWPARAMVAWLRAAECNHRLRGLVSELMESVQKIGTVAVDEVETIRKAKIALEHVQIFWESRQ